MKKAFLINFALLPILWLVTHLTVATVGLIPAAICSILSSIIFCRALEKSDRPRSIALSLVFSSINTSVSATVLPFHFRFDGFLDFALLFVLGAGTTWVPLSMLCAFATCAIYSTKVDRRISSSA
jgi:hypothetical protein